MLELLCTPASMDYDWEQIRLLEQEHIAEGGIGMSVDDDMEMALQEIGMKKGN